MKRHAAVIGTGRDLVLGLLASMVPRPESLRLARLWRVDVASYSFAVGVGEAAGGGLGFFFGAISSMSGSVPLFNMLLLENWFEGLNTTHFRGGGVIALLMWFCHPLAWWLATVSVTGVVRIFAFVGGREPAGEPLVWLGLRLGQLIGRIWRQGSSLHRLGPLRPDRLVWGKGADLTILCCRPRDEWLDTAAVELDERFFAPEGVEQRHEGAHDVLAYRFRELDPNDVIRGRIPYVDTTIRCAVDRGCLHKTSKP